MTPVASRCARLALAAAVEAGRDDGDHDLVAEALVEARAEDDVGLRVRGGADLLGGLGDLVQRSGSSQPVMLNRMPWAPAMSTSSSGLAMAWRAASTARFSPVARPMPISAEPASFMIARTSAKSRLMSPGIVMMSLMPWTPWRRTSSTTRKASRIAVFFWTTSLSRSFGIVISVSTLALSSSAAFSAISLRLLPSKRERLGDDADRQGALLLGDLRDDRAPRRSRCRRRGRP